MRLIRNLTAVSLLTPCVGVMAANPPINTPTPMLQPSYPACEQFHQAVKNEDCQSLIAAAAISHYEFFRINPAIGGYAHCKDRVIPGTWYCFKSKTAKPAKPVPMENAHPKPTQPPKNKSEKTGEKASKTITTKPPVASNGCIQAGYCHQEWAQIYWYGGKDKARALEQASDACTGLFNTKCGDPNTMGFPGNIAKGCFNCEKLSSACPCFLGDYYTPLPTREQLTVKRPSFLGG